MSTHKMPQGGGVKGLYALKSDAGRVSLAMPTTEQRPLSAGSRPAETPEEANSVEQRLRIVKRNRAGKEGSFDSTTPMEPADPHYPRCLGGCRVEDSRALAALVNDVVDRAFFPDLISL
jgi:hypothetical protein